MTNQTAGQKTSVRAASGEPTTNDAESRPTAAEDAASGKAASGNAASGNAAGNAVGGAVERVSRLATGQGSTTIADAVVQKIAGLATREVSGVHDVGGNAARAFGAIRERIPGASASVAQGVSVEVGTTQAAVDLEIVVEYGVSIRELSRAVRRNVITAIEHITDLEVVEVNINVNDIHIPGDDEEPASVSGRVQ